MSEQEQMPSQEQVTSGDAGATQTGAEQTQDTAETLDQVYAKFNVDQQAQEFSPQRQQAPQPQQQYQAPPVQPQTMDAFGASIPDPILNPDQHKAWLASQNTHIRQALSSLHGAQQQMAAERMRQKEEADIQKAVATVKAKVDGVDDDFIEIALGQKARKDPRFLSVYNNRDKNPQAWNAALNAVSNEFKQKFAFKPDAQIAENVRAAKQSTQTSLTTRDKSGSGNALEQRLEGKVGREFDAEWRKIVSGGY